MASNTLSINKIILMFQDIANRHKMINQFSYGPLSDVNTEGEFKMPYLHIENTTTTLSKGNGITYREVFYDFDVYIMDRINKGDNNYVETTSDTLYILHTIITEISQHPYYVDAGLKLDGDINTEAVFEVTDDNVNGHKTSLRFKQGFRYTPCTIPIDEISGWTFSLNGSISTSPVSGPQGPQGPTGPQGATGPGINYFSSTSTGTTVTGTTSNTFSKALLVATNSYRVEDAPQVDVRVIRTGTSSNSFTTRLYWNTTPNISGTPILVATSQAVSTGNFFLQLSRLLSIVSATNSTAVQNVTITTATDYGVTTSAQSTLAINWTQLGYLVVAIQLVSSTDNAACTLIKIN
jgi:hypothetical protein